MFVVNFEEWFSRRMVWIAREGEEDLAREAVQRELGKIEILKEGLDYDFLRELDERLFVRTANCISRYAYEIEFRDLSMRGGKSTYNIYNDLNWHAMGLYEAKRWRRSRVSGRVRNLNWLGFGKVTREFLGIYLAEKGLIEKV